MKQVFILFALLTLFFPLTAQAKQIALTADQKAELARVEAYLSGIRTIVADFVQIAPDGGLATGKFYLARPGKMRWQYDPPTPILMIANQKFLTFYDYELDQISHIPLESTLAGFLARERIRFGNDVVVTALEQGLGSVRLTIIQQAKPDDGSLTLEFATNPLQLRNMVVVDSVGQETTVALNNARFDAALDNKLFIFEDPRIRPNIGGRDRGILR